MTHPTATPPPEPPTVSSAGPPAATLARCLLLLRLGVFSVMFMWTIDKFINPEHAAAVFAKFYKIPSLSTAAAYAVGAVQLALVLAFVAGFFKTVSYGAVLVLHFISTATSWAKYIDPWTYPNLLFFAALPMLAACWTLWSLRRWDTLFSVDATQARNAV